MNWYIRQIKFSKNLYSKYSLSLRPNFDNNSNAIHYRRILRVQTVDFLDDFSPRTMKNNNESMRVPT